MKLTQAKRWARRIVAAAVVVGGMVLTGSAEADERPARPPEAPQNAVAARNADETGTAEPRGQENGAREKLDDENRPEKSPEKSPEKGADEWLAEASRRAAEGKSAEAVQAATRAIAAEPGRAVAYYLRGREHFRLGKIAESAADFDRYVELAPAQAPRQWERGITLYYAGRFQDGAKQFEDYQTFDSRDVENSVWRYLCLARASGVEKARATMLPIENDPRTPMMEIYALYRGEKRPEQVLEAARADSPPADVLAGRLFYAHLYLGLYHEAAGDLPAARKYIALAADPKLADHRGLNRYMWDVARIHHERLTREAAAPPVRRP